MSQAVRCLSVDVEDYFHIEAAHGRVAMADWSRWPLHVERNVDLLLEVLAHHQVQSTFFILGWVARRLPHLACRIASAGHEIASHGDNHQRLHRMTPRALLADLLQSRQRLEDQVGCAVLGYRAPTFSLTRQTAWAVDVLAEAGYVYDASIFPVRHPWYGVAHAPDQPFQLRARTGQATLLEIPALTWRCFGRQWPVAGGGYFRLFPLWFLQQGLRQAAKQQRPAVLYFHPWEFDPLLPRLPLGPLGRLRTYTGLGHALKRLQTLLQRPADWRRIDHLLDTFREHARQRPTFLL